MKRKTRLVSGGVVAATAIATLACGCTTVSTAADQRAVVYSGDFWTSQSFSNCVDPATRKYESLSKNAVYYPAGQRTYVFSDDKKPGSSDLTGDVPALHAPSKDQVLLTIDGQVQFELTSDCAKLRKFHEQIGIKYGGDWEKVLQTYLAHAIGVAVTNATQKWNWTQLYTNQNDAQTQWAQEVDKTLPDLVKQAMGDDYFTISGVILQKPVIPPDLQSSVEAYARAQADNAAQQQKNAQVLSEADGIKPLIAALGGDVNAFVLYQALKDGKLQGVLPVPQGSPVIVQPGR